MTKLFEEESEEVKSWYNKFRVQTNNVEGAASKKTAKDTFDYLSKTIVQLQTQLTSVDDQQNEETLTEALSAITKTYTDLLRRLRNVWEAYGRCEITPGVFLPEVVQPYEIFSEIAKYLYKLDPLPRVEAKINSAIIENRWKDATSTTTTTSTIAELPTEAETSTTTTTSTIAEMLTEAETSTTTTTSTEAEQAPPVMQTIPQAFETIMEQRLKLPESMSEKIGELFMPIYAIITDAIQNPTHLTITLQKNQTLQKSIAAIIEFLVEKQNELTQPQEISEVERLIDQLASCSKLMIAEAKDQLSSDVERLYNEFEDLGNDEALQEPSASTSAPTSAKTQHGVPSFKQFCQRFMFKPASRQTMIPSGNKPDEGAEHKPPHQR